MNIFVIILNWNGFHDTLRCLKSLEKTTYKHTPLVVDNGSSDESVIEIKNHFPHINLIQTGGNLGYAGGNNIGIRAALKKGADAIILLNNDTVVSPNFIEAFLIRNLPLQGGNPHLMSKKNLLDHQGGKWNSFDGDFDFFAKNGLSSKFTGVVELDYVCGVCMFIKKEVFENIGVLDQRFFLFWEESDFCFRALSSGYQPTVCPEAILYHKVSASFTGGKPHTTYFFHRNRLLWIKKNCPKHEYNRHRNEAIFMLFKTFKLLMIKTLVNFFRKPNKTRKQKLQMYVAKLYGILDFFTNRFGNAPYWLFKK